MSEGKDDLAALSLECLGEEYKLVTKTTQELFDGLHEACKHNNGAMCSSNDKINLVSRRVCNLDNCPFFN